MSILSPRRTNLCLVAAVSNRVRPEGSHSEPPMELKLIAAAWTVGRVECVKEQ